MGIFGRGPSLPGRPSRSDRRRMGVRSRPRPHPATRRQSERRMQMMILGVAVVVVAVVLGVGIYGYYETNIRPAGEPVISVGDRSFGMGYMERRLRYMIRNAASDDLLLYSAQQAVETALTNVMKEEINRQGAPALGLWVSDQEIDAQIRELLSIPETADTNTFAESYRREVRDSGLKPSEYREVIAAGLLEDKLRAHFRDEIPDTAEQVRMRSIQVSTEEEAEQVLLRLEAGEDFAALAQELSPDTATENNGEEEDWTPRGVLNPDVEDVVFALEAGQTSEPVPLGDVFYLFQLLEKAADRELTDDQRQELEDVYYYEWQSEIRQEAEVATYLDQESTAHLLEVAVAEGVPSTSG